MTDTLGIPAATAVLARDGVRGLEVLMLKRSGATSFAAGAWVFPGGRVDPADATTDPFDSIASARRAAVRETREETGIDIDGDALVVLSHWIPGPEAPKRYATWLMFCVVAGVPDVTVDGGEIVDYRWMAPSDALEGHRRGEMELLPPTWMTLRRIVIHHSAAAALTYLATEPVEYFVSRVATSPAGRVILWPGDAGYETGNADTAGARHRLHLVDGGWRYEGDLSSPR